MAKENEEQDGRGGLTSGRTRALMALVAVITAIAIWLVPDDEKQSPLSLPPLPSAPDTSVALPLPSVPDTSEAVLLPSATDTSEVLPLPSADRTSEVLSLPPPPGGVATITNGGDGARAFIYELRAGGAQPEMDVVFTEAERMQGEGNLEDAYLLYRFAARHGQVQAAMMLGTQADPAFHTAVTSYLPEPDPGQAYRWYSVAAAAGNDEAEQRLQGLRKRVQQDAAAGDEQARRLLLQWR
jgi:hypothetical protein